MVADTEFNVSGVHWSWGNRQKDGREAFHQKLSAQAENQTRAERLWDLSLHLCGVAEPEI